MRFPDRQKILQIFSSKNVIVEGHFIYASEKHGKEYFNKDAIYPDSHLTAYLCSFIAEYFKRECVEVVLAPAIGGIDLKTWISYHLSNMSGHKVLGAFAEKTSDGKNFHLTRGYGELVLGKRTLVVEDVLNSGYSANRIVRLARSAGADVIGVGALCNRGGITAQALEVPLLYSVLDLPLESWPPSICPLCRDSIPFTSGLGRHDQQT